MKQVIIVSATIVLSFLTACSGNKRNEEAAPPEATQQTSTGQHNATAPQGVTALPSFAIEDVNGQSINLQSFKGKKVFVNLWASWCPPCRREMPSIEKLYQSVDKNKVAFVMLSLDDHFQKAKRYMAAQKLTLPVYYPAENLPLLFNVRGIPATFIFNENGELIERIEGSDNYNTPADKALLQ